MSLDAMVDGPLYRNVRQDLLLGDPPAVVAARYGLPRYEVEAIDQELALRARRRALAQGRPR